jgi:hypothetical protein
LISFIDLAQGFSELLHRVFPQTMKNIRAKFSVWPLLAALAAVTLPVHADPPSGGAAKQIPEPLKAWAGWATWGDDQRECPTPYSDAKKHLCFWPSRMGLQVDSNGAQFDMAVKVFQEAWMPLPGGTDAWPMEVRANGAPVAVLEHEGNPAVHLAAGVFHLEGSYHWNAVPQRIAIPREIGILALVIDGKPVDAPAWDAQGILWLKRDASTGEADKNFLSVKLYAAVEDGIPLWLRTQVELTVAGKSREEDLGAILPEGWKLAAVESPIPVAVDDAGRMKAQVRAGKWVLHVDAFRFDNPKEFRYAKSGKPAVGEELLAFRARPEFRTVEIVGSPSIDVSQTTFPQEWRELPVYRWDTGAPFRIEERMRGMGQEKPEGLRIVRELWLDEGGRGLTFQDHITGRAQQIWRLDAAAGQNLGSVRSGGQGQLITRNPQNGASGVEIRTRDLTLEATGRMARTEEFPATGWRTDADALNATLNLPPGWRLFALFGADWVRGDWLTSWTLLDLFVLLIFSLAVVRIWGMGAGLLAFLALGLSYHEPGAPRYLWLVLLAPLALQRMPLEGGGRRVVGAGKWIIVAVFALVFLPFIAQQTEQAIYPQLEVVSERQWSLLPGLGGASSIASSARVDMEPNTRAFASAPSAKTSSGVLFLGKENLAYDAKARIQTGPGVPEWKWRAVSFGWNGPVSASQEVTPVLISLTLERALTVLRVILLVFLAAALLGARKIGGSIFRGKAKAAAALVFFCMIANAPAQSPIPDEATLDKLRARLLEVPDAYPNAADIPSVSLALNERKIVIEAVIHTALRTAVPLPGKLPAWSPLNVLVDDKPEVALRRDDGYLWVVLEAGVHHVRVEGSLANVGEWEWTFLLKPRQVKIEAPGWTFSGVKADGTPEAQVFFALKQKATAGAASYDRQDLQSIVVIDRDLEFGLVWQVRTTITRLSPAGKAIAIRVPLLPGENVLSSNAVAQNGFIDVRLGAQEKSFTWESGLAPVNTLPLATRADDAWVERWRLVASPIWNVHISGLAPTFESGDANLVPVWQPWPGESVELAISRPEAIAGATVTVSKATHSMSLGKRQRVSQLDLSLRCSLGEDFLVELPADAEVTSLSQDARTIPVREDAGKLIIPVRPGEQTVSIGWRRRAALDFRASADQPLLPVESANIETVITVPEDRWVLWAEGPRSGPAVRFWGILACSLLAALVLSRVARSPMGAISWMLLVIGLTQVPLIAAFVVVGWLFFLAWRGSASFQRVGDSVYNTLQAALILLTPVALVILLVAVGKGLLGRPEMFIVGNGSTHTALRWFQARSEILLPHCECLSVSIWWYRLLMLVWALWLAASLIRWLQSGWQNFSSGGFFRGQPKAKAKAQTQSAPPPLPTP